MELNDQREASIAVPYVLDDGEGEVIRWFGDTLTVKVSGPSFDVAVVDVVAGNEPPLHRHEHDDEALYVINGVITVLVGDEELRAERGAVVFLPRAVPHTFAVESGTARLLSISAPTGALAMFSDAEERFGPRNMPARPRSVDFEQLDSTLGRHGVILLGGEGPGSVPRRRPRRQR